jgi:hypothetical protein
MLTTARVALRASGSWATDSCVSVLRRCYPQRRTNYRYTCKLFQPNERSSLTPKWRGSHRARQAGRDRRVYVPSILLITIGIATALAACGSSGKSSSMAGSGSYSQAVRFANCMRSHEVSQFPDPPADGHFPPGFPKPEQAQSPAFQSAETACRRLAPSGFGQPPKLSASQRQAAVRFAHCMRTHGVPNFPIQLSTHRALEAPMSSSSSRVQLRSCSGQASTTTHRR